MLRLLVPLLLVAIAVALVALTVMVRNRLAGSAAPPEIEPARWRAAHESRDGVTHVLVRREITSTGQVLDEREVETVADDDPDYDARFMEAIATARARADIFNDDQR